MVAVPTTKPAKPGLAIKVVDLVRPLVLLAAFLFVEHHHGFIWAAPLAFGTFLAASVLVHDLIHNALDLPLRFNDVCLSFYSLFLIKSGHALRRLHLEHHARCLEDDDREGNVIYIATWKLLLTGPFLALQARWLSWKSEKRRRWAQLLESVVNVALTLGFVYAIVVLHSNAAALYFATVVFMTVTVPIAGAKVPHLLPEKAPRLVRALRPWTSRLTPAASSLLFHELHHRRPKIPAAQLAENQGLLETTNESNCAKHYAEHAGD